MKQTTLFPPAEPDDNQSGRTRYLSMNTLPLRDKDFPSIIKEIVTNAPANRKVPSFIVSLAPLSALATRLRLHYFYDGDRPSAVLLQIILEAPQSSGKQFAADIERLLIGPTLKVRDEEQRRIEQNYRERKRSRGANQKMEDEPKTTIRVIPATISKTVLVKRADFFVRVFGEPLTMWIFSDELSALSDAGRQSYSNLRTIMRTAYDLNSLFGIDFMSDQSYSAMADILISSLFCATPSSLDDYFTKSAIEGGNITRTVVCTLDDEIGADGAIFEPYSEQQMSVINRTLKQMMDDCYTPEGGLMPEINIETAWLDKTVRQWCMQKGEEALKAGSLSIDVFRKRSSVSAFRATALCYYLYQLDVKAGSPLTEGAIQSRCRRIYLFLADYILTNLINRWGNRFEELQGKRFENVPITSRPRLIDRLSVTFTRDQLKLIMEEQQVASPARVLLCQWKTNGWIEQLDENTFRKCV